jgi:hypothetical protein
LWLGAVEAVVPLLAVVVEAVGLELAQGFLFQQALHTQ